MFGMPPKKLSFVLLFLKFYWAIFFLCNSIIDLTTMWYRPSWRPLFFLVKKSLLAYLVGRILLVVATLISQNKRKYLLKYLSMLFLGFTHDSCYDYLQYRLFFLRFCNFLQKFTWIVLSVHKLNKVGKFW